jgi:hypothetical protein
MDLTSSECKELGESLACWCDAELGTDVIAVCDWHAVEDLLRGELPQPLCLRCMQPTNHEHLVRMMLDKSARALSPEMYEYLERDLLAELITNTPTSDAMEFDEVAWPSSRAFSLWVAPAYIGIDRIADGLRRYVPLRLVNSLTIGDQTVC